MKEESEDATTQVIAHLLMVVIVIILAALVLLIFHLPNLEWDYSEPPVLFEITSITSPEPSYESKIYLRNVVHKDFHNKELSAKIYCNDALLPCTIETINNHDFISTAHYGVNLLYGQGGNGNLWNYNQMLAIDLSDGFIHPGDIIRVDIIKTATGNVISRDSIEA